MVNGKKVQLKEAIVRKSTLKYRQGNWHSKLLHRDRLERKQAKAPPHKYKIPKGGLKMQGEREEEAKEDYTPNGKPMQKTDKEIKHEQWENYMPTQGRFGM